MKNQQIEYVALDLFPTPKTDLYSIMKACPADKVIRVSKKDFSSKQIGVALSSARRWAKLDFEHAQDENHWYLRLVAGRTERPAPEAKKASKQSAKAKKSAVTMPRKPFAIGKRQLFSESNYIEALATTVKKKVWVRVRKNFFKTDAALACATRTLRKKYGFLTEFTNRPTKGFFDIKWTGHAERQIIRKDLAEKPASYFREKALLRKTPAPAPAAAPQAPAPVAQTPAPVPQTVMNGAAEPFAAAG